MTKISSMLDQVFAIAFNTYRENVRARLLHGLFAVAMATAGYALVVGAYAFRDTLRVVSDIGAASVSLYAVVVAVVLGATSLHRELEHKTVFPILARPMTRASYLVGKFVGSWLTLAVFVLANTGVLFFALGGLRVPRIGLLVGGMLGTIVLSGLLAWKVPRARTVMPMLLSLMVFVGGHLVAGAAHDDRKVLLFSSLLTLSEVAIVIAIASVFSAFSSPFLSAILTLGVVVVGRSADTLAELPERVFGPVVSGLGRFLSVVVPNLMVYVPPRTLLTGESKVESISSYLAQAGLQALAWVTVLLVMSNLIFRRRDFV